MLALLAFLFACHDKPSGSGVSLCESNPGNCKSVLESKDFFLFKVGSYWVYEEETTHERDSMYVTECINDENGYNFSIRIHSALTDYDYHFWPTFYPNIDGCNQTGTVIKKCLYVNRSKGKFQDNLGDAKAFFINYHEGDILNTGSDMDYCPNGKLIVSEVDSSYLLSNQIFHNVVKIFESCPRHEGFQPVNTYYSKNIGIIRKELLDSNQVWNLVNHYVIQ